MADEDRSFEPRETETNRSREQGVGMGARELDQQRDPSRPQGAIAPDRTDAFDTSLDPTTNADRPSQADFGDTDIAHADAAQESGDDRNAAGMSDAVGDLGLGTPANVDIHKLGQRDKPEEEWGEAASAEAQFSSNHNDRGLHRGDNFGHGAKTRQFTKDQVSRRT